MSGNPALMVHNINQKMHQKLFDSQSLSGSTEEAYMLRWWTDKK